MPPDFLSQLSLRRLRILWIVLGALLLVSVVPLWLYHKKVLTISETKLADTERLQQSEATRSLAEEALQFESHLREQLISLRQVLALTGWIQKVDDPTHAPQLTRLLQNFVENNPDILYVTAVGTDAKGESAGSFRAERDPFVDKALKRAFTASIQELNSVSTTFAVGTDNHPAFVLSVPLMADGHFTGMLAAVISLNHLLYRLQDASVRHRIIFLVDGDGHVIVYPNTGDLVAGSDMSGTSEVVRMYKELPQGLRNTATVEFSNSEKGRPVRMIGAYSTIPELRWAVIAQRNLEQARSDAGVDDLNTQALKFVIGVMLVALIVGYRFAVWITTPIRGLVDSTRAISRAEFHERVGVRGAAEISELAETFNNMAGDIEKYVLQLKRAAEENRELFLGSIRMLSAAIDEKDPYTRGHSGRVAKYSVLIGEELGLDPVELDNLRISALLHDVGKIGVDDRVLKKPGSLTSEEFEVMKQHPVKGANIMRPVSQLKDMLPGIELHHENVDGRGYPYGIKGEQIPLMARIIAVADTFDAMTTNRPYQSAMEIEDALARVRKMTGTKFDSRVTDALEAAVREGRLRLNLALVEV